MKGRGLVVAAVFLMGCAVGGVASHLVVPKASAQQQAALTRWEYKCSTVPEETTITTFANTFGAESWELFLVRIGTLEGGHQFSSRAADIYCFKRPKM